MKTLYFIQSSDYILIKESINNILKEHKVGEECLIKYDLNDTSINTVIEDLDTFNFLVEKKIIVCDNAFFLTGTKARGAIEQDLDSFVKYLKNPSNENVLVLICDGKLDERKTAIKLLREKAIFIDSEVSINKIIKSRLEGFKMEDYVINYFIEYCGKDNEKILNELEKLKCYKFNDKIITYDDIDNIVIKNFSDNIFSLIEAMMKKNREKAVKLYYELIKNGEDENKILSMLCDQFRMIYNGRVLLKENNNNSKLVASILGINAYRFQKAIDSSYGYTNKDILKYLNLLDEIEIGIKTGKSTISAFEIFIYSL